MSRCYSIICEDGCSSSHRDPDGGCYCPCHDRIHECPGCSHEYLLDFNTELVRVRNDGDDYGGQLICRDCVTDLGIEHRVES